MTWSREKASSGWRPWIWLGLYVIAVYATTPFTLTLVRTLGANAWDNRLVGGLVLVAVLLVPVVRHRGDPGGAAPALLPWLVIGGLYVAAWTWLCKRPAEALHLLQYSLMSILAWTALRGVVALPLADVGCLVLTALISWGNELLQSMIPDRVYDIEDVLLDGVSGLLGLMVARQLYRSRPSGRSV